MTTPKNISFAHLSKFRLVFPYMDFLSTTGTNEKGNSMTLYCSHVNLPTVAITQTLVGTPYYDMKISNRGMAWGDLTAIYSVDEYYSNFEFLYKWFMFMHNPELYNLGNTSGMVDASLMIYSNNDNPKFRFSLKNVFPIGLSGLEFSKEAVDNADIKHSVTFSVDYYKLEREETASGN
jgi:hypothetical protein